MHREKTLDVYDEIRKEYFVLENRKEYFVLEFVSNVERALRILNLLIY